MSSIETLKKIFDEIDYPCYIEFVDCVWMYNGNNGIYYNTDDSVRDMEYEEGMTYSLEFRDGSHEHEGYLIVNGDTGCGDTVTYFFNLDKEIK